MQNTKASARSQRASSVIAALPVIATTFAMYAMVGCRSRQLKMRRPDNYSEADEAMVMDGITLLSRYLDHDYKFLAVYEHPAVA